MSRSDTPAKQMVSWLSLLLAVLFLGPPAVHADDDPLLNTPPPKPVRIPAEFEPMQAVVIEFWSTLGELYKDLAEDVRLIFIYGSEQEYSYMLRCFSRDGVDLDRCEFYPTSAMPVMRDGLPWFMFVDHNEPAFVHNQLMTDLCALPAYGLDLGYPVYRSGLRVFGGNFMTDGQGTAVSLDDVFLDHAEMGDEFAERVEDYWGVDTYHFIDNERWEPNEYLHIDCLAKFLSPDTIMVARVPLTDVRREQSEQAAAYFARQVSCYGTPYRVVRVDVPNRQPYINSLILNRRVFVPITGSAADAGALASYEAAMPGYEVIAVYNHPEGRTESIWAPFYALHCDSMGIADEQMLYLEHVPLLNRPAGVEGFPIRARIVAHSRTEFVEGTPVVWWRTLPQADSETASVWSSVTLARAAELGDHQYLTHIPAQPVGTEIQYYLQARDASGRDETHPYIGQAQAHTFAVTRLGANVSAISAQRGGTIEITMNAGLEHARQSYRLRCSLATDSGTLDGSDQVFLETVVLTGFEGVLDEFGIGTAQMTISGPLTCGWVGTSIDLSLELENQSDAVPDTIRIQILGQAVL